jgi:flagellar biosynthesis protein FlhG
MRAAPIPRETPGGPAAIVIGSGKGGVGKSALAVLLSASLARRGRRVLLFDGAQNQGNLHVLLGVRPRAGLDALLEGDVALESLLVDVSERLALLPCESGADSLYGLTALDRARLHQRLSGLYDDFDTVIVDAAPGIESVVRATIRASRLAVVAVPEPASLSDAYALIKIVSHEVPSLPIDVVVNRARDTAESQAAYGRLRLAAERFLGREIGLLGTLAEDATIGRGVREPGGLLAVRSEALDAIATRMTEA